ncbi:hypothetical protein BT69DRAFT_1285610 [Atractiella rhizophila]|nr:hypothetical protein BT69DRAFT_1285610 [Atractiella rhizophila]
MMPLHPPSYPTVSIHEQNGIKPLGARVRIDAKGYQTGNHGRRSAVTELNKTNWKRFVHLLWHWLPSSAEVGKLMVEGCWTFARILSCY